MLRHNLNVQIYSEEFGERTFSVSIMTILSAQSSIQKRKNIKHLLEEPDMLITRRSDYPAPTLDPPDTLVAEWERIPATRRSKQLQGRPPRRGGGRCSNTPGFKITCSTTTFSCSSIHTGTFIYTHKSARYFCTTTLECVCHISPLSLETPPSGLVSIIYLSFVLC